MQIKHETPKLGKITPLKFYTRKIYLMDVFKGLKRFYGDNKDL